jgi:hypothetical protein
MKQVMVILALHENICYELHWERRSIRAAKMRDKEAPSHRPKSGGADDKACSALMLRLRSNHETWT